MVDRFLDQPGERAVDLVTSKTDVYLLISRIKMLAFGISGVESSNYATVDVCN